MPHGDRTGPYGAGPMTGRGRGYCAGYDAPGFGGRGRGRGGRGRGYGWGAGACAYDAPAPAARNDAYGERAIASRAGGAARAERIMDLETRAGSLEQELLDVKEALARLRTDGE